jgi:AcrR family transcriptional regulator
MSSKLYNVSSKPLDTRERLLEAARGLLEQHGPAEVGMEEIARAAGVSRQAAYLHFKSRRGLLLELVVHVDRGRNVDARVERLWQAESSLRALDEVADLAAHTNAEVHRIGMALDAARRWDPDFDAAWQDRMRRRHARYRRLARWLLDEGALGKGWTAREAAWFIWMVTSLAVFDLLVTDMRLSKSGYVRLLRSALRSTLQGPFAEPAKGPR